MITFRLSFFWRLISAFILCGMLPLFLLSVVFTGASTRVIDQNNRRNLNEIVTTVSVITENSIKNAFSLARTTAADESSISYCSSFFTDLPQNQAIETKSLLISDIYQKVGTRIDDSEYQVFLVPLNGLEVLSRRQIPNEYQTDWYGGWGILNAGEEGGQDGTLFIQPHPDNGNEALAAVIFPVISEGKIIGYAIVDILRKAFTSQVSRITGLQGALDMLYLYDSRTSCIMYSHFPSKMKAFFSMIFRLNMLFPLVFSK